MYQKSVTVKNASGLHARPASRFVTEASAFASRITLVKDGGEVDAKSILGIMSMAITQGTDITIRGEGPDEVVAVDRLVELIEGLED
ncbi:HPr family phosphocarrier protein [Alicyclobacillus acidoterrestris]|uniref:Phosphocarrier protein HPr n=1 Tax=Alicyclobacillus acidoterrestris (strain ATCC 49025 / DSM 3922 / CIP 106132 / NCIMB 13137 / GD3B) TaxID=1356854 RepID=T0BQ51_ALIAG|nr:HPr family phosphocarrier protein [Alicyclobacillus acidoterrestris]EPZ42894.1 hypothetical protein N007_13910 [Alicyclobacillus acidoterrestris ATCC 49025]UNO50087.1 HPr family phosphocarrier protein [Alicyclobacillus acidoterrestris]